MYGEIIFKILIVVALILTFVFIWIYGDKDDYSFVNAIVGQPKEDDKK
jgi:hypothetical protein